MTQPALTEKQLHRLRENRRANVGLTFSIIAIVVSVASFLYPVASAQYTHVTQAKDYLEGLVQVARPGPYLARGSAAKGSDADLYADTVGRAWETWTLNRTDEEPVAVGTVTGDWGEYVVCFPALDIFPTECSTYSEFEYSDQDKVTRFSIDGMPIDQLYNSADYEKTATYSSDDGNEQVRAYYAGKLFDPSGVASTVILRLDRSLSSTSGRSPLSFDSLIAQNGAEEQVTVYASYFPETAVYYETYFAVVRVPRNARFLHICWSGVPEGEKACDWTYNLT
jgi:hypothetical protein